MSGTWRVFSAELYRLVRSRVAWVAGAFLFLVPVLRVFAARVVDSSSRLEAARAGRELLGLDEGLGWAPLVEGWRAGLALGALLLLIHGARTLAGDRDSGVLRLASTRTASRAALVVGRALLGPILVLLVVAFSGLGAWLAARQWFDFGPLVEDDYLILSVSELLGELRLAVLAALPALWAVHTFGLFVSSLARTSTGAVASSVAVFLAFDLFKEALGESRLWVFASYAPSFVDSSAMQSMASVALGYSDAYFAPGLLRMNFILPWPQAILLVLLAAVVSGRRRLC